MELTFFEKYCDVEVWDLSNMINPAFSKSISSARCNKKEVNAFSSLAEVTSRLADIRNSAKENRYCILTALSRETPYEVRTIIKLAGALKNTGIPVFEIYNGGLPTHYTVSAQENPEKQGLFAIFAKLTNPASFAELRKKIIATALTKVSDMLPQPVTHRLVAGDQYLDIAKKKERSGQPVQLVFGHCQDYSNALVKAINEKQNPVKERTSVLLDAPGPMFTSDYAVLKRKVFLTVPVWYPSLSRFFDRLENETNTKVKIAGHYKSTHPFIAECFGNREVHYHKTKELIQNCDFVITRSSAAISYAVLFRKPVIFIYSDELLDDELGLYHTFGLAGMLGTKPVNIDHPPADLSRLLQVDLSSYEAYEKACLTSSQSKRPNVQIILEDIMNISTGSDFAPAAAVTEKIVTVQS